MVFSPFFAKIQPRKVCLASGFSSLLLVFSLFATFLPTYGAYQQTHGCAPTTPPPVPGTLTPAPTSPGIVMVNEVLSQPRSTWNCSESAGVFSLAMDSWVELYNTQSQPFDLYAAHAQISLDGGSNWYVLPSGSAIAPLGFLVMFPAQALPEPPLNWTVILALNGTVVDQTSTPALQPDQSYARVPDGMGNWQLVGHPTIDASNNASAQPVTATPTKTPGPTRTPGPTKGTGSRGNSESKTPTGTGTQPAWNQLQIPVATASSADTPNLSLTPAAPLSQPATRNSGLDNWYLALYAGLILLLGGALCWCWRLFRTP